MIADKNCIAGAGHPEGSVKGEPGSIYLDGPAGVFYYKGSGSGQDAEGWIESGTGNRDFKIADGDATPNVSLGKRFRAVNSNPTVITNFAGGRDGQMILVILDRNTSIQQNANIDTAVTGPGRVNFLLDGSQWKARTVRGGEIL